MQCDATVSCHLVSIEAATDGAAKSASVYEAASSSTSRGETQQQVGKAVCEPEHGVPAAGSTAWRDCLAQQPGPRASQLENHEQNGGGRCSEPSQNMQPPEVESDVFMFRPEAVKTSQIFCGKARGVYDSVPTP